jgi:hypothetical protein
MDNFTWQLYLIIGLVGGALLKWLSEYFINSKEEKFKDLLAKVNNSLESVNKSISKLLEFMNKQDVKNTHNEQQIDLLWRNFNGLDVRIDAIEKNQIKEDLRLEQIEKNNNLRK